MLIILILLTVILVYFRYLIYCHAQVSSIDEYFWLQYRLNARKQKFFPPKLPQFLLDLRQWYPPIYGFFLKLIPDAVFKNNIYILLILSAIRFINYLIFLSILGVREDLEVILICLIIYIASPSYFINDNQLNSRILGSIIFDIVVMLVYLGNMSGWGMMLCTLLLFFTMILLFLHKMTVQLLIFLALTWALWINEYVPFIILIIALLISIILGYKNYFKAHIDITKFWFRNRNLIGAHQINDSPTFSKNISSIYSVKEIAKKILTIVAMCPFFIVLLLSDSYSFWTISIISVLAFAYITTFVPFMKTWGHGRSYMYYLPSLIIMHVLTTDEIQHISTLQVSMFILCFPIIVYSYFEYKNWLTHKIRSKSIVFDEVISFVQASNINRIMCIPIDRSDEIAWKTGRNVLWGGHGYGFKLLMPYFPILKVKPEIAVKDWNIGAVIVDKNYWEDCDRYFPSSLFKIEFEKENYIIYSVTNWQDNYIYPQWAKNAYPGIEPDCLSG